MKKRSIVIILIIVFIFLLVVFNSYKESAEVRQGTSFSNAIVITASSDEEGVSQEYDYLDKNACLNKGGIKELVEQDLLVENLGITYDILTIQCINEDKEIYYFDISSFWKIE